MSDISNLVSALVATNSLVRDLVYRVDGLLAHYTAIDADYQRLRDVAIEHDTRIIRLEQEHNYDPSDEGSAIRAIVPVKATAKSP